jgi:hypothetical protein
MKSSPKDFAILCLLSLTGTSLSSFSRVCSNDSTEDSIGIVLSGAISVENLTLLRISFTGKIFSKNVASRD